MDIHLLGWERHSAAAAAEVVRDLGAQTLSSEFLGRTSLVIAASNWQIRCPCLPRPASGLQR